MTMQALIKVLKEKMYTNTPRALGIRLSISEDCFSLSNLTVVFVFYKETDLKPDLSTFFFYH